VPCEKENLIVSIDCVSWSIETLVNCLYFLILIMLTTELLEQLEAEFRGQLSPSAQQQLHNALDELPQGQEEAATYRRLWVALAAWQAQTFQGQAESWEADHTYHDDAELIELYLRQELHPANRSRVEHRRTEDPVFDQQFRHQEQLLEGFTAVHSTEFQSQVTAWEQALPAAAPTARVMPLRQRWARVLVIAAGIALLLVAGVNWLADKPHSDVALAEAYYRSPPMGNTLGGAAEEKIAYLQAFDAAHQAMRTKDFTTAAVAFQQLSLLPPPTTFSSDDLKYYQDNIGWSLILARLANRDVSGDFAQRLELIATDETHTYHQQAIQLQDDLAAFWRK